jgi:hypothetical protein
MWFYSVPVDGWCSFCGLSATRGFQHFPQWPMVLLVPSDCINLVVRKVTARLSKVKAAVTNWEYEDEWLVKVKKNGLRIVWDGVGVIGFWIWLVMSSRGRSQWPHRLRRESAAARLLGLRVRIPQGGAWISASCDCCVLSSTGLCLEPITLPEESYRVCCVWMLSQSLDNEDALPTRGCCTTKKKRI